MDTDLVLTLGIVLLVLTIPSLLSAWVDGRFPRVGTIILITAVAMIVTAQMRRPGGYSFEEVPEVMLGVLARAIS